jgi:hypothetical protein
LAADATVVYTDRGISRGMQLGIDRARTENRPIEFRSLGRFGFWDLFGRSAAVL